MLGFFRLILLAALPLVVLAPPSFILGGPIALAGVVLSIAILLGLLWAQSETFITYRLGRLEEPVIGIERVLERLGKERPELTGRLPSLVVVQDAYR